MNYKENAGYYIAYIKLLNGRIFNRLLSSREDAKYSAEQGKILSVLWLSDPRTATDLSLETGLANNTLTSMLKKLEEHGLIYSKKDSKDQRKTLFFLTQEGREQEIIGNAVSEQLEALFYQGFSKEEKEALHGYLKRVLDNLLSREKRWKT